MEKVGDRSPDPSHAQLPDLVSQIMTVPPPLGLSPQRPKQDKYLQEEGIEHRTGEKNDLKKKKGRELRNPT